MTWEYIAGFFDGEGWLQKFKKPEGCRAKWRVAVGQSTKQDAVIFEIGKFLNTNNIRCFICTETKVEHRTQMTRLVIGDSRSIVRFLEKVLPHVYVKQSKCALALQDARSCVLRLEDRESRLKKAIELRKTGMNFEQVRNRTKFSKPQLLKYMSYGLDNARSLNS